MGRGIDAWCDLPTLTPRRSVTTRFGDAIRNLRPQVKESPVRVLSACTLAELDQCSPAKWQRSPYRSDDEQSTESGPSSLPGSLENECEEEAAPSSSSSSSGDQPSCVMASMKSLKDVSNKAELEHIALLICQSAESKYSGAVYQDVRNAFLAVDRNGDGKVTDAEVRAFFEHFRLPADIAVHFFKLLDRHGDGNVDWRHFMAISAPMFRAKSTWRHKPTEGRRWPALR